jgi:hypothetical protein
VIYAIRCPAMGRIKIGYSKDPADRLVKLNGMAPSPLELIAILPGDMADETLLHKRFQNHRIHGEWFSDATEIVEFFCVTDRDRVEKLHGRTSSLSIKAAAGLLGVDPDLIRGWIAIGFRDWGGGVVKLKAKGRGNARFIKEDDLHRFICRRELVLGRSELFEHADEDAMNEVGRRL